MHKQRSPFTTGTGFGPGGFNFNPQQFVEASNFGSTDGLNGMPFLTKPLPVKHLPKDVIRSLSHQRDNGDGGCGAGVEAMSRVMAKHGGERVKSLATPSTLQALANAAKLSSFNGNYEGDISSMLSSPDNEPSPLVQQIKENQQTKNQSKLSQKCSDAEFEMDYPLKDETSCQRAYNYIKSTMAPQHQERLDTAFQYCIEHPITTYILVMFQFISVVSAGFVKTIQRVGIASQTRIHFWRYRYHLRSTVRNLLWRMANAKANDTMLFLIIVLVTPWLFLLGLFGFAVSFVVYLKTVLTETIHQMHMRLI